MTKKPEEYISRIHELISLSEKTLSTKNITGMQYDVNTELFSNFMTSGLSCIKNMYGESHPFYKEFENQVLKPTPYHVERGKGILMAIKSEIEGGWFFSVKRLVTAEIFSDFIDMAKYLLDEKYKDPAAVMLGSILEEHLRQLALKNGVKLEYVNQKGDSVTKKTDTLNADLTAIDVYNKLDQKQITAWLDLRNKAAHGKYGEFKIEQVNQFYSGLLNFINRISI